MTTVMNADENVVAFDRITCDMRVATGRCGKIAHSHLDQHGCGGGPVCVEHLKDWRRRTARALFAAGGSLACNACGQPFSTVDDFGSVTTLRDEKSTRTNAAERGIELLTRYETQLRGAGRSQRWITDSLSTLRRLETQAGTTIDACSPHDVSQFLAGPQFGPATRAIYYRHINGFFRWWKMQGGTHVTESLIAPREPRSEPLPASTEDVRKLVAEASMYKRTRVMILLAALAGLRVHEIAKFRGEDIDLNRRILRVRGKGSVTATIPLHPLLVEAAASMPNSGYWFPANSTRPGKHVHSKSVTHVITLAMQRAGISGSPHKLRSWFATSMLETGVDIRTVQTLLRHARLSTTALYTGVTDKRRVEAIDRLNPFE
ncbi:site-specific recombinase XerD [Mycobacterium sp. BK086]|uniref:tyrosine-type recombinase/integrase n=1 Tax=Mycobacterium sp. BK086 TaxID=2512165 RepID=UPI0010D3B080|nr:tyrosine-type recombinase/integrase [Mycobacterium sp. BK086]TDO16942.1 site-specific recombinase XerD [Mycobacterium sp. BK086]